MLKKITAILGVMAGAVLPALAGDIQVKPGEGTIQAAVDRAEAGDTIWIHPGRYAEHVVIQGKKGISLRAADQESVPVITGALPVPSAGWALEDTQKNIWKLNIGNIGDIWQLFLQPTAGGRWRSQVNARWPNATHHWDDPTAVEDYKPVKGSYWDIKPSWARLTAETSWEGPFVNDESRYKLSDFKESVAGAVIMQFRVLKTGNSLSAERITEHRTGSDRFQRTILTPTDVTAKIQDARYYLESKRMFLDAPGEWFYDKGPQTLYVCLPFGETPEHYHIEGRNKDYILEIENSSDLSIQGLELFGGAFSVTDSQDIHFEDCRFLYSSCSKWMLGIIETAKSLTGKQLVRHQTHAPYNKTESGTGMSWLNCEFAYNEGCSIYIRTKGNRVENCYVHHAQFGPTIYGAISDHKGSETILRRNTYHTLGVQNVSKNGPGGLIEYNHAHTMLIPGDFSCYQVPQGSQSSTVAHHNWAIHCDDRNGQRFDGDPAGTECLIHHIVSMKNGRGFRLKGDNHQFYNLTSLLNRGSDVNIAHDKFYGYKDPDTGSISTDPASGWPKADGRRGNMTLHGNENSKAANIAGQYIESWPLVVNVDNQGGIWSGAVHGGDITGELRDPENLDFRPKKGSVLVDAGKVVPGINDDVTDGKPDIGAYEFGATTYWIPGRRFPAASTPIPPDGTRTAKDDADLMWLEGYRFDAERGDRHRIFCSLDPDEVEARAEAAFLGEQVHNICAPGELQLGRTYYWCVDEVIAGKTVPGMIWQFTPNRRPKGKLVRQKPAVETWICSREAQRSGDHLFFQGENKKGEARILLKFRLPDVRAPLLGAFLQFDAVTEVNQVLIYRIADNWSASVGWEDGPAPGELLYDDDQKFSAGQACVFDLSEAVKAALDSGQGEIALLVGSDYGKRRREVRAPELHLTLKENQPPYFNEDTFSKPYAYATHGYLGTLADVAGDRNPDDIPHLRFAIENGPGWLKVDPETGDLYGTPPVSAEGVNRFNVSVSDGRLSGSSFMTITVKPEAEWAQRPISARRSFRSRIDAADAPAVRTFYAHMVRGDYRAAATQLKQLSNTGIQEDLKKIARISTQADAGFPAIYRRSIGEEITVGGETVTLMAVDQSKLVYSGGTLEISQVPLEERYQMLARYNAPAAAVWAAQIALQSGDKASAHEYLSRPSGRYTAELRTVAEQL